MKTLRIALAAAIAAAFGVLGLAAPAQAYPTVTVTVGDITVVGGTQIVIHASSNPSVNCVWTVSFSGASAPFVIGPNPDHGTGPSFDRTYDTKRVSETKTGTVTVKCVYDDTQAPSALGGAGRFSTALSSALQTASATGTVTLLPRSNDDSDDSDSDDSDSDDSDSDDSDDNGGLPDTGGERLLWLLIGLLLVAGGTTVIIGSRREDGAES